MLCQISAISRIGGRQRNEDACAWQMEAGLVCCVLADGAGGHGGGHVASRLAVQAVLDEFLRSPSLSVASIHTMIARGHEAVVQRQTQEASLADMRTTLVVLLFDPGAGRVVWGHIGDSRLYCFRHGRRLARTLDHSLVQSMIDTGMLSEQEAQTRTDRNILVASIGTAEPCQPTVVEGERELLDGDVFLLCSDGWWGPVSESGIESDLADAASTDDWLARMAQRVTANASASADNYSAIGVWCGDVSATTRIMIPSP